MPLKTRIANTLQAFGRAWTGDSPDECEDEITLRGRDPTPKELTLDPSESYAMEQGCAVMRERHAEWLRSQQAEQARLMQEHRERVRQWKQIQQELSQQQEEQFQQQHEQFQQQEEQPQHEQFQQQEKRRPQDEFPYDEVFQRAKRRIGKAMEKCIRDAEVNREFNRLNDRLDREAEQLETLHYVGPPIAKEQLRALQKRFYTGCQYDYHERLLSGREQVPIYYKDDEPLDEEDDRYRASLYLVGSLIISSSERERREQASKAAASSSSNKQSSSHARIGSVVTAGGPTEGNSAAQANAMSGQIPEVFLEQSCEGWFPASFEDRWKSGMQLEQQMNFPQKSQHAHSRSIQRRTSDASNSRVSSWQRPPLSPLRTSSTLMLDQDIEEVDLRQAPASTSNALTRTRSRQYSLWEQLARRQLSFSSSVESSKEAVSEAQRANSIDSHRFKYGPRSEYRSETERSPSRAASGHSSPATCEPIQTPSRTTSGQSSSATCERIRTPSRTESGQSSPATCERATSPISPIQSGSLSEWTGPLRVVNGMPSPSVSGSSSSGRSRGCSTGSSSSESDGRPFTCSSRKSQDRRRYRLNERSEYNFPAARDDEEAEQRSQRFASELSRLPMPVPVLVSVSRINELRNRASRIPEMIPPGTESFRPRQYRHFGQPQRDISSIHGVTPSSFTHYEDTEDFDGSHSAHTGPTSSSRPAKMTEELARECATLMRSTCLADFGVQSSIFEPESVAAAAADESGLQSTNDDRSDPRNRRGSEETIFERNVETFTTKEICDGTSVRSTRVGLVASLR